jgi:hypothetical protein
MSSESAAARNWLVIAAGIALVAVVGLIVILVVGNDDADPDPTPLQQVLQEIGDNGTWSRETALRAFAAVFGPLPGVEVPEGPEAEVEFGTIAIRMLSLYVDEITPEQREAALAAAGPLAEFLNGSPGDGPEAWPGTGPTAIETMGFSLPADLLAADADDYEAEIAGIVTGIESRIGRPLGLEVEVVVSPDQVGILHATALPVADDGENITECRVTVLPNAQGLSGKNLTAVLAHETWHCFEYSRLGTLSRRNGSPPWIMEGQAMWVGEAYVGGSAGLEPADRHWKEYLIDPGPGKSLFARSYDAIGFYSHLHDQGIDPWTVLDPILDQTSNLAAFNEAVGGKSLDVVTTWAPSWYRDGSPTSTFSLVNAPGIPGPTVRPAPVTFTISNGTFQQVTALKPLSAEIADVAIASEILTIDVMGQGMVGDMMFGNEIPFVANSRVFCMVEDCSCPDGAPGPSDHLGEEIRVAVTGDALSGSDALLRGWSIAEWCQEKDDEDDPAPPGSGGGPGTPCSQGGCGSSNGDPHLTTIDGRSYDFQAAGEFVLLRSDAVEVQTRQEPYRRSTSVSINTAVAVTADGGRAAVYADGAGLRLLVDGTEAPVDMPTASAGLEISPVADGVQIEAPDGTIVWALGLGEWGLNVLVSPSPELRETGTGLLSGSGTGPLPALPDGTEVDVEDDYGTALYTDLADGWEVTAESTLFDYEEGAGPQAYRDRSIPEPGTPLDFMDLSETLQELGLEQCGSIVDEALLLQCAFDVAVTDDTGFVQSYELTDQFVVTTIEEEPGSITGGQLSPLLEDVAVVVGSALDDSGSLYLSVRFEDQHRELLAIDPVAQTVVSRVEMADDGQIVFAAGSLWMSATTDSGCAVFRFDPSLELEATIDVPCVLTLFAPQLVGAGDAPWIYRSEPELTRIDPSDNSLAESIPLPFSNGYLRSTGATIFYSDLEEGVHRLLPGAAGFEPMGTEHTFIHPAEDGFWEQVGDAIVFQDGPGPTGEVTPTDGILVGATDEAALVERKLEDGTGLWAHPADGGPQVQLASAPMVGTGSEARVLDYFDNYPPLTSPSLIVKLWVEHVGSGDDGAAVFVQAIDPG